MAPAAPASITEVLSETEGRVGIVTLNRPRVLNALSYSVMEKIVEALEAFDKNEDIRAIVLTGSEKAFAAGADIGELAGATVNEMSTNGQMERWDRIRRIKTPLIAAVSGYAFGGGCELAMACDTIVASETAQFAQPEINIGVIPGAGGTQRLTRAVGKAIAMDMVLTGRRLSAKEALGFGLVSRVVPVEAFLSEALRLAQQIAAMGPLAAAAAKDCVARALDLSLEDGLSYERNQFYQLFASEDQKEGMAAFREKRKPNFKGR